MTYCNLTSGMQNLQNVSYDGNGNYRNMALFPSDWNLINDPETL